MARVAPLLGFLGLWYAFNAAFNVQNKVILNKFPYPWAASWVQLASGILFFVPAWLTKLRSPPNVDTKLILRFLPIAAYTAAATACRSRAWVLVVSSSRT